MFEAIVVLIFCFLVDGFEGVCETLKLTCFVLTMVCVVSLYEVFCENKRGFNLRNLNLFFYEVNMNVCKM